MPGNTILNYFSRKKSANASEDKEGGQGTPNATPPRADLKRTLSDSNKDNFGKSTTPVHAGGDSKKPRIEDDQAIKFEKENSSTASASPARRTADVAAKALGSGPSEKGLDLTMPSVATDKVDDDSNRAFPHLEYDFLLPEKIRDADGRRPGQDGFRSDTLKVPASFLDKQTPAHRQWWEIKSQHLDTVLFFKMGKFYELFHMDAVLAVRECGLGFMKKDYAHCGFPEGAFHRFANLLIDKGLKVARIEQVETPKMMEERVRKQASRPTKFDKVVRRDICELITAGTRTFAEGTAEDFLLAIVQEQEKDSVGVTVLNASLSRVYSGQFEDDARFTKMSSILTYLKGAEVLFCHGGVTKGLSKVLECADLIRRSEVPSVPDPAAVASRLKGALSEQGGGPQNEMARKFLGGDCSSEDSSLSVRSFLLLADYLTKAMVEKQILSFRDFYPLDSLFLSLSSSSTGTMELTGATLENLDVVPTEAGGAKDFSLLSVLDSTNSQFGRRLLKQWVCNPLAGRQAIVDRQGAIKALESHADVRGRISAAMRKMCDFDRFVARVFAEQTQNDNDDGAIFYNRDARSKAAVQKLVDCLRGLEEGVKLLRFVSKTVDEEEWQVLDRVLGSPDSENVDGLCKRFRDIFNFEQALESGQIRPAKGVNKRYDEAKKRIAEIEAGAEEYRREQCQHFDTKEVSFFGSGPNAYQLEVPDSKATSKKVTDEYVTSSRRKGFSRYLTPDCEKIRESMAEAEEDLRNAAQESNSVVFGQFCSEKALLHRFIGSLSTLDCLLSLHRYSYGIEPDKSCFPDVQDPPGPGLPSTLSIATGLHPLLLNQKSSSGALIPNDVDLDGSVFVLSGANMGGKSTVMRQTALLVILAQLGCKVPATGMKLNIVDKLFSRMGASDNMLGGESTLLVELSETSRLLAEATGNSLVLIDELGRGTATHDGCAIARAVIEHFVSREEKCRVMLTTHYHQLISLFVSGGPADGGRVRVHHMDLIEPDEEEGTPLTFLYKVKRGACSRSHGFNAAACAGIPAGVVEHARTVASDMEEAFKQYQKFRECFG